VARVESENETVSKRSPRDAVATSGMSPAPPDSCKIGYGRRVKTQPLRVGHIDPLCLWFPWTLSDATVYVITGGDPTRIRSMITMLEMRFHPPQRQGPEPGLALSSTPSRIQSMCVAFFFWTCGVCVCNMSQRKSHTPH
jgi:hypothetical protein